MNSHMWTIICFKWTIVKKNFRIFWVPVILPLMPRRPIESGLGSPAQRGSGKSSGLVCFAKLKSFPARTGAECVSVSPLQAIGLVESLLDDIWLICGSVHPPLSSVKFRQVRFLPLDSKYPKISASRKAHWPELSTYFKYPQSVRTLIYTTKYWWSQHRE